MPGGLVALLDDVAVIARTAAASVDDIGIAASRAGSKTAGVVIDDAAVTPSYVTGLDPSRELPIIGRITLGSLKNKLLILLPGALLLSWFLPQAIVFILMMGGCYLSFEGAEKVIEKLGGKKHGQTLEDDIKDPAAFEKQRTASEPETKKRGPSGGGWRLFVRTLHCRFFSSGELSRLATAFASRRPRAP